MGRNHPERSLNFRPRNDLQFALLDSELRIHVEEFRYFYEKLAADATVVFHDTAAQHEGLANAIRELIAQGQLAGPSSRLRAAFSQAACDAHRNCRQPLPPGHR